ADGLEVHAEDHRCLAGAGASVRAHAVNLIDDGLYLDVVIGLRSRRAIDVLDGRDAARRGKSQGRVRRVGSSCGGRQTGAVGGRWATPTEDVRIDFRRVQIIDVWRANVRAINDVVGRVLVGPCSLQAGGMGDAEDRVDFDEVVREYLGAGIVRVELLRQEGRIDAPAKELRRVEVDRLVEHDLGTGGLARAASRTRRVERAVVAVVVVDTSRLWQAAGKLGEQAWEGVGGRRRRRVRVGDAVARQVCKRGLGILRDPPREVLPMKAIDAEEQHTMHLRVAVLLLGVAVLLLGVAVLLLGKDWRAACERDKHRNRVAKTIPTHSHKGLPKDSCSWTGATAAAVPPVTHFIGLLGERRRYRWARSSTSSMILVAPFIRPRA